MYKYQQQSGFSLVECLVVLTLSALLIIALLKVVLILQKTQHQVNQIEDLSQRGRYLAYYVDHDWSLKKITAQVHPLRKLSKSWQRQIKAGSNLLLLQQNTLEGIHKIAYFIGHSRRRDAHQAKIYALYKKRDGGRRFELIRGIIAMRLSYLYRHNNQLQFAPVAAIKDWSHVVMIKAQFLLQSMGQQPVVNSHYYFCGKKRLNHSHYIIQPWTVYVPINH